jgi:transposase InsO family protein
LALPAPEPEAKPKPEKAAKAKPAPKPAKKKRWRAPMEVKLLAVQARKAGLHRKEVARLAGVSTTTIDTWCQAYREQGVDGLAHKSADWTTRKICDQLTERIIEHRKQHPEHGVRRIRDELRRNGGLEVSAETVRQVVNEAGLGQPPPQAKRRPPQVRRFERAVPNAMWQIDIFTFELKRMYRVYLVGIIDDHSRYIVGHGLFRQQKAEAVMEVVKGAIGQWGAPREILSDNGRQFVAWRGKTQFQKTLKRQGIGHVRSAPHHPMTLGKIERFWKTIWTEFLEDAVFASFADASQRLAHWVAYYNHQRPHQGIKGACPADRFYGIAGDMEEAIKQGCDDNALRLALGQVPEPPLFLLGKLGDTDVRVVRKGADVEVRLGDQVHEVIRIGTPLSMEADGTFRREGADDDDSVEGSGRGGAVSDRRDGEASGSPDQGDLRDVWPVEADALSGDGQGGRGVGPSASETDAWSQAAERDGAEARGIGEASGGAAHGARAVQDEVRDRAGLPGPGAAVRPGRVGGGRQGEEERLGEKKESEPAAQEDWPEEQEVESRPAAERWPFSPSDDGGEWPW